MRRCYCVRRKLRSREKKKVYCISACCSTSQTIRVYILHSRVPRRRSKIQIFLNASVEEEAHFATPSSKFCLFLFPWKVSPFLLLLRDAGYGPLLPTPIWDMPIADSCCLSSCALFMQLSSSSFSILSRTCLRGSPPLVSCTNGVFCSSRRKVGDCIDLLRYCARIGFSPRVGLRLEMEKTRKRHQRFLYCTVSLRM